jgi:hypothetical protein
VPPPPHAGATADGTDAVAAISALLELLASPDIEVRATPVAATPAAGASYAADSLRAAAADSGRAPLGGDVDSALAVCQSLVYLGVHCPSPAIANGRIYMRDAAPAGRQVYLYCIGMK